MSLTYEGTLRPFFSGFFRQYTRCNHDTGIAGVGATGDRRDYHRAMKDIRRVAVVFDSRGCVELIFGQPEPAVPNGSRQAVVERFLHAQKARCDPADVLDRPTKVRRC